jgi:hypothetical protein
MRALTAFALYLIGDLIWRAFDGWTRIGMHGPIYRLQSGLMGWSEKVQGDGPGPWTSPR